MSEKIKRKHIRFTPDENTIIKTYNSDGDLIVGLAMSEAHGGCAGVFLKTNNSSALQVDQLTPIEVGNIKHDQAQIKWIRNVDENVIKIGFEVIE